MVAVGPVDGYEELPYGGRISTRSAKVVPADAVLPDAELTVAFPESEGTGGFAMHGGYAFNRRVALLLSVGLSAGVAQYGINHVVGGPVVRVWPASRLWLEAGPAFGDIRVGLDDGTTSRSGAIKGSGFQTRAGVSVIRKPRWTLDAEAGYSRLAYDGFKANTVTFAIGASRLPL
jgi:hypothetical protein